MYAIVEIAGQQFKVEQGKKIFVHRQAVPEGDTVEFDQVLLIEDGDKIVIGEPTIKDMVVEGKIIDNTVRGDKVVVFKKKRRKGYRVKNGHRQDFTQVEILGIGGRKVKKTVASKEDKPVEQTISEPVVKSETKVAEKKVVSEKAKTETKTDKKAEVKTPAIKKPAAKKPVAKKPATEKAATKKTATEKPAEKKPAEKKPAAKKPATKKSSEDKSVKE